MAPSLAASTARLIAVAFAEYHDEFRAAGREAGRDFLERDWVGARERATTRLALYGRHLRRTLEAVDRHAGARARDRELWVSLRPELVTCVADRPDRDIAETFFNSLTRRRLRTVGVDADAEFTFPERRSIPRAPQKAPLLRVGIRDALESAITEVLRNVAPFLTDPVREARRVASAIRLGVGETQTASIDTIEVLAPLLYRNKGAYLVGMLVAGSLRVPLAIALLNDEGGPHVDAVLNTENELSILFGFSWSYFLADLECPSAVVAYLATLMPQKRADELYTSLGYNRHGKSELYRALLRHLEDPVARFEEAEGIKGLVMSVFTLPSLNVVFKLIRDGISPIKHTNRREVMNSYQFVFNRDRVGRLADAQEFERLVVPRRCVPDSLLAELTASAASNVTAEGDRVVFTHLYTQRRVRPLNMFLHEAPPDEAAAAVLDYGQALKDLAAADIFPGDMLTKNCGLSRHGRVIFYDFDELSTLDACVFREIPETLDHDEEISAEPWFSVGEHDVFPEQFAPFLIPAGPLADLLRERHGELYQPEWWRWIQGRVAEGEMFDTFPYPPEKRLPRN
jgi:isocitrate dehydrogenase kinase/phosphatase